MPNVGFLAHAAQLAAEMTAPADDGRAQHRNRPADLERSRRRCNDRIFIAVVIIILCDSMRAWSKLIGQGRAHGPRGGSVMEVRRPENSTQLVIVFATLSQRCTTFALRTVA